MDYSRPQLKLLLLLAAKRQQKEGSSATMAMESRGLYEQPPLARGSGKQGKKRPPLLSGTTASFCRRLRAKDTRPET
jgi:hypothetical protein